MVQRGKSNKQDSDIVKNRGEMNKELPLVSIVTLSYNKCRFIEEFIL